MAAMMAKGERYKEPVALATWTRSRRSPAGCKVGRANST